MGYKIPTKKEEKANHARRKSLQYFAQTVLSSNDNRCDGFAKIVQFASTLVQGHTFPSATMMEDLCLVLIGEGLLPDGRGQGGYYVGEFGSTGFKKSLQDTGNQIHHAMAGLYIGWRHVRLVQWAVTHSDDEPWDRLLYRKTMKLGRELDDQNYRELAGKLREVIGDKSCGGADEIEVPATGLDAGGHLSEY